MRRTPGAKFHHFRGAVERGQDKGHPRITRMIAKLFAEIRLIRVTRVIRAWRFGLLVNQISTQVREQALPKKLHSPNW